MRIRRRRRKGFDEERKRVLRNNLRNYFINSKNLNYDRPIYGNQGFGEDNYSEAATASADIELDPQAQLERARKSGFKFGNISISPPSNQERQNSPSAGKGNNQDESDSEKIKSEKTSQEEGVKSEQEEQDTSDFYTRYQLEQMEEAQEQTREVQHLVDLPAAIESDNRDIGGHSIKAFADPYIILKELLWMARKLNPELDVMQRLWLVWAKWSTYYNSWFAVNRDEYRLLPGDNRMLKDDDGKQGNYNYRGIHQLETCYLESTILQAMRWEFAVRTELERQFNPMPTLSQLHGYFVSLNRRDWDRTSWQYRVNLGAKLAMQEEDDEELEFTPEE